MKHAKFEKVMDQAGDLPTLPAIAQKVVEIIQDSRSNARDLTEIIELDPVISAQLVRLANSAYYRMAGAEDVASVHRAIVVLGFMHIRNIVLTTCLHSLYAKEFRTNHFTARDLWIHSVTVAVISRALARIVAPDLSEEAFMAGLVHDVGMIVEWNLFPKQFPQVLQRYQGTGSEFCLAERQTLGFDHCESGAALLRRWKLPKHIREVAAHHHKTHRRRSSENALPELVQVAERLCATRGDGFFDFIHPDEGRDELIATLGIDPEVLDTMHGQIDDDLRRACDLLAL